MHRLESSFGINGRFTDEEISSHFADPDDTVQGMILGSTDPAFRKACMLAIIDNCPSDAATLRVLSHPDFKKEIQALLE